MYWYCTCIPRLLWITGSLKYLLLQSWSLSYLEATDWVSFYSVLWYGLKCKIPTCESQCYFDRTTTTRVILIGEFLFHNYNFRIPTFFSRNFSNVHIFLGFFSKYIREITELDFFASGEFHEWIVTERLHIYIDTCIQSLLLCLPSDNVQHIYIYISNHCFRANFQSSIFSWFCFQIREV